jgi:hypothetical protein
VVAGWGSWRGWNTFSPSEDVSPPALSSPLLDLHGNFGLVNYSHLPFHLRWKLSEALETSNKRRQQGLRIFPNAYIKVFLTTITLPF